MGLMSCAKQLLSRIAACCASSATLSALAVGAAAALFASPAMAQTPGPVVISQIYGGGNLTSATYRDDYVELFNRSAVAVDISSWSIQQASLSGTSWARTNLPAGTILAPGQYYLMQFTRYNTGTAVGAVLPVVPDSYAAASGTTGLSSIDMGGTTGKIALVRNQATLPGVACPNTTFANGVVDMVTYGAGGSTCETAVVGTMTNAQSALRNGLGCDDSNSNLADFTIQTASTQPPRNSSTALAPCGGTGTAGFGACLVASTGVCNILNSADCTTAGGAYSAETPCAPRGACCVAGVCTVTWPGECSVATGSFAGAGTTCYTKTVGANAIEVITTPTAGPIGTATASAAITLPFQFAYFGVTQTQVWFNTNGLVGFGATTSTSSTDLRFPNNTTPNNVLSALWNSMSLVSGTGTSSFGTNGASPNRVFLITWTASQDIAPAAGALYTYQVALFENTNAIEFRYGTYTQERQGGNFSIGLENAAGTTGQHLYSRDITSNSSVNWSPNACPLPTGACCTAGACTTVSSIACSNGGGVYLGNNFPCTGTPCDSGACCLSAGGCSDTTFQNLCVAGGGSWTGGSVCSGVSCPTDIGRCCVGIVCSVQFTASCATNGGSFLAAATCVTDPCVYCTPSVTTPCGGNESIGNVTISTINNSSVCGIGYEDFTTSVAAANVARGETVNLSALIATWFSATDTVTAFIDWNHNNVLDNAGEIFPLVDPGSHTYAAPITIPVSAALGATRLRVRLNFGANPGPCGNTSFGNIEDYVLNVQPEPATGICCVGTSCSASGPATCAANSGGFVLGGACNPDPCTPPGACCDSAGGCTFVSVAACNAVATSTFRGEGNACASVSCVGLCYKLDGSCAVTATGACLPAVGAFQGFSALTCPAAGACCTGTSCTLKIPVGPSACPVASYQGDSTLCNSPGTDLVVNATDVPLALPDNPAPAVSSTIPVASSNTVNKITVTMDVTHTFPGDITLTLTHGAKSVVIWNRLCGGTDNIPATTFSDGSPAVTCGVSGTYAPSNPLSAFIGDPAGGNWVLSCIDAAGGDFGTLNSWSVTITPNIPNCPGACCTGPTLGTCNLRSGPDCATDLGSYLGAGTSCTPNPCVTGACCTADGICTNSAISADCTGGGGFYQGDNVLCSANPCPTGGCCSATDVNNVCVARIIEACTGALSYLGENVSCGIDPCPIIGRCCVGPVCSITFTGNAFCANTAQNFAAGATCATMPCAYCNGHIPVIANPCGPEFISNSTFLTINQSTATCTTVPNNGYRDFSAPTVAAADVTQGTTFPISVTVTNWFSATDIVTVFVDFDHNNILNDAGESFPLTDPGTHVYAGTITVPVGGYVGTTRIRVRMNYGAFTDPCIDTTYGTVEDYTLNILPEPIKACCLPTLGCQTAPPSVCISQFGGTPQLTANSCTPGLCDTRACCIPDGNGCQLKTQSECSTLNGIYTSTDTTCATVCPGIGRCCTGANLGTCSITFSTQCLPANFNAGGTDACSVFPCDYCSASSDDCTGDENISNVVLSSGVTPILTNPSGNSPAACYSDFSTSVSATPVARTNSYTLTVTNLNPFGGDQCKAWVDFNQDKIFDLFTEEFVITNSGDNITFTGTITVPVTALLGNTRLRIRLAFTGDVLPCDGADYGEVEDYTLNILPEPTGGCCLNGACLLLQTAAQCAAAVGGPGIYQGDNSSCTPAICANTGACCLNSGGCSFGTEAACPVNVGTYRGNNTACATVNPECAHAGACCETNGTCTSTLLATCNNGPGWLIDTSCSPNPCPGQDCPNPIPVTVGVDVLGSLSDSTNNSTVGGCSGQPLGGIWYSFTAPTDGDYLLTSTQTGGNGAPQLAIYRTGTPCGGAPTLCLNPCGGDLSTTLTMTQGEVVVFRSSSCFFGAGDTVSWDILISPLITGACCLVNGGCSTGQATACTATVGTYRGDNSTCATVNPECAHAGACCNVNGTCVETTLALCSNPTGFTVDQTCANTVCPATGACCTATACTQRIDVGPLGCTATGGNFLGAGQSCNPVGTDFPSADAFPVAIPDNTPAGVNSTLSVVPSFPIAAATLTVSIPDHTFIGDLIITLSHGATSVIVWNQQCGGNNGMTVTFDDAGAAVLCAEPTVGTYLPANPLTAFIGASSDGLWTLNVSDNAGADTGSIASWSINLVSGLSTAPCAGACCGTDGNCTPSVLQSACTNGGIFAGPGSTCGTANCASAIRCCVNNVCQAVTSTYCTTLGGTPNAALSCIPEPCLPTTASCCPAGGGACIVTNVGACGTGTPGAAGSTCTVDPCDHACCNGAVCTFIAAAACANISGATSSNTSCSPSPCNGACCNGAGGCSLQPASNCTTPAGAYQGNGVACSATNCGVCCRGSTCVTSVFTAAACSGSLPSGSGAGASYVGGTACGGINHKVPCCYADYNKVGGKTVADIFSYLTDWFAHTAYAWNGLPGATGPGNPPVSQIFAFLSDWFAGC